MPWTLCKKEDVTAIHPINESELQDFWSETVEGLIRQYKGTPNLGVPTAITGEVHNGDGSNILVVRQPPIVSVESLLVNDAAYSAGDYKVKDLTIQLASQKFPDGTANVVVSYTSGSTANVDAVVRFCAATMIVAIINYRGRAGADGSIKFAQADVRMGKRSPNVNTGLIAHLTGIMAQMVTLLVMSMT